MSNLITIKTVSYLGDLAVISSFLDSEGIYYVVQNERIGQYPSIADGISLQVREEDVVTTVTLLKDAGFIREEDLQPSKIDLKLQQLISKIPFLKKIYTN